MRLALNSILRDTTKRLSERLRATSWGDARRWFRMQGRLRSHEPTQIVVCAAMGAAIGALIAGLHKLVDWGHVLAFNIAGGHSLSAGIGIDMERVLYVPVVGGLLLGLSAVVMRYFGAREIVDPIEANALHGGRMSMRDSLRLVFDTFLSNVSGVAVGMEAGYSQLGASVLSEVGQDFKLRRADQRIGQRGVREGRDTRRTTGRGTPLRHREAGDRHHPRAAQRQAFGGQILLMQQQRDLAPRRRHCRGQRNG